jgi:hypothetical protein
MRRLIYSSRWSEGVRKDAYHTLQAVVGRSIQNNRLVDITGFLISHNGHFLQVLEGPSRSVAETFARIAGDPRHTDMQLLADLEPVEGRAFRGWSMAGAALWDPTVAADFDRYAKAGFDSVPVEILTALLQHASHTDVGRVPCSVAA